MMPIRLDAGRAHPAPFCDWLPEFGSRAICPDRGGYTVTMRESFGFPKCIETLRSQQGQAARLHVGWGSFRNLDIVAARRSDWVILLDVNVHQFAVWRAVSQALRASSMGTDFIDALLPLLPNAPPLRQFKASTREWLETELDRDGSWLDRRSPEAFDHVRRLFLEDRVVNFCLDMRGNSIGGIPPFEDFGARLGALRQAGQVVPDTLYISNIPWMLSQPHGFFGESHTAHLDGSSSALSVCRRNISMLCPHFERIVSAMRLSPASLPSNLQWKTEVFLPGEIIGDAVWAELE